MTPSDGENPDEIIDISVIKTDFAGNSDLMVPTLPADGLAPFGARTSAGIVMTKLWSCIYSDRHV